MVLLEDHGLLANTLVASLSVHAIDARVVDPGEAGDLVAALLAGQPELALLDLDLGEHGTSLGLIGPLTAAGVPVLVVTGVTDLVEHARCIAAGAIGVLGKSGSFDDLVASIEAALVAGTLLSPEERERYLSLLRAHVAAERGRLGPFEQLTPREAETLGALMRGCTVEDIARVEVVSVSTVRSHVRGVLTKLGVSSQLTAVARAVAAGWQPPPAP